MALKYKDALDSAKNLDWDQAHEMIQPYSDKLACLIHGYLHRVEGDLGNARYWYDRAGEKMPDNTLDQELNRLYELVDSTD